MIQREKVRIVLVSSTAFYPQHWLSFKEMTLQNNWEAFVITWRKKTPALLHLQKSWLTPGDGFSPNIFELNGDNLMENTKLLKVRLRHINPDIVWIQEEPINIYTREILRHYLFTFWSPRIYCAVCENNFARFPLSLKVKVRQRLLWHRLNG